MLEYKIILGVAAVLIGIAAYIAYFRNIFAGKTKPHAFSWLVWGIPALETFSIATVLYPAYLIIANFLFVALLLIRRQQA